MTDGSLLLFVALQCMLPTIYICCDELIKRWDMHIGLQGSCEFDVEPEFQGLTGDVISRTAFGSSFKEGRRIFQLLEELAEPAILAMRNIYIPGYRCCFLFSPLPIS